MLGLTTHLTTKTAPAAHSEKTYDFKAREICVTIGRVDGFWNAGDRGGQGCRSSQDRQSAGRF
jgi:hypothetical protein